MSSKYKNKHEEIIEICKTALTFTEVEARFRSSTPNTSLRRYIRHHNIPMPMYQGMRAGNKLSQKSRNKITQSCLCENSITQTGHIKRHLIKTGQKQQKCEQCDWAEKRKSDGKIPIQLHHKNGDSSDNRIENLQFLCPNCHSLTENYAGKNKCNPRRRNETFDRIEYYSTPTQVCENCGKLGYGDKFCSIICYREASRKVKWPSSDELAEDIKTLSWVAIGKKYGVSDNTARKWAKHYELIV